MKIPHDVKKVLEDSRKILIILSRPIDNDCLASGIVLARQLEHNGKKVDTISPINLPSFVDSFPLHEYVKVSDPRLMNLKKYDLIIAVDGGNTKQFADVSKDSDFDFDGHQKVLNIDHHLGNTKFSKFRIWDPEASSTTEVLLKTLLDIEKISKDEATLLYGGLVGDTGNFRYAFDSNTLILAAKLLEKSADSSLILNEYFYKNLEIHFEIFSWMIQETKYNYDLGYSYVIVEFEKLNKEKDWNYEEVKGGLRLYENYFMRSVENINISFIIKLKRNKIDISMRGNQYYNKIPLPEIGRQMGYEIGGHFNSAGFSMKDDVSDFINRIDKVIKDLKEKYS